MKKRQISLLFLAGYLSTITLMTAAAPTASAADAKAQEFYELRIYRIANAEKQEIVSS